MKDMNAIDVLQESAAEYEKLEGAMIKLLADYVRVKQELAHQSLTPRSPQ